ncbi:MAG TPA: glycogen debranching N-terminal domain-containing protein [Acidobacteriota bacterium]|nr:glycogen debranching N-terminal domain-containing protein [Acidobacteriota bacterium]
MTDRILHKLVRLRPRADTLYVTQNRTVLATELDGFVDRGKEKGLFVHQTRLLSCYRYRINEKNPVPVALSNVEQHSWLGYYILLPPDRQPEKPDEGSGQLEEMTQNALELRISRFVSDGIHEDVDLTNFTQQRTSFELKLEVDADFADAVETKGNRQQFGEITKRWETRDQKWQLEFDYIARNETSIEGPVEIHRGLTLQIERSASTPTYDGSSISFAVELNPHQTWHCCINLIPYIDGKQFKKLYGCRSFANTNHEYDLRRAMFFLEASRFVTPKSKTLSSVVIGALEQAKQDLAALRLYGLDLHDRAWIVAAGLPIYVALFGRDTLTVAMQSAMVSASLMRGTLPVIAELQGKVVNDWRDEQPGKMLHEAHTGPLAVLNYNPRSRYYGSATTSGFYPVIVAELWHWTGDKELVGPLIKPAMDALRWLDQYGDLDHDGFYEYQTRSTQGVENQGWKDSGDAIVYEDGSQVRAPIATCEEQAFAFLAKLHLSEVLWWFDEKDEAKRLYNEAQELKKRFNDSFWMEKEGFFAMALDPQKRQVKSIGSNAGHCIAAGIINDDLVKQTGQRLFESDLFTGWGIRTLSSKHPAYNPYSYHRGSVWPVEHGTFAIGFTRYGLHDLLHLICHAQFNAAALFEFYRLPELFGGHQLDEDHPFPALYPQANSPQAWSASAVFYFVQAMLGLYPYAPLKMLLVDPHLPSWLPEITVEDLQVGEARISIRFYRNPNGKSDYEILHKRGTLHVFRQPSPWSLTASFAERLKDALVSLLPGK